MKKKLNKKEESVIRKKRNNYIKKHYSKKVGSQNYTDISFVLDRSGSMSSIKNDVIGGFNEFLKKQKKLKDRALFSLFQFDHEYEVVYTGADIQTANELDDSTFVPRGMTSLLDAIGRTIESTEDRIRLLAESDKPKKVMIIVMTDGYENNSKEFDAKHIFKLITDKKENNKWEFIFLGANQDAITTASQYGISAKSSLTYNANAIGTMNLYSAVNTVVASYRTTGDYEITDEDRKKASKEK